MTSTLTDDRTEVLAALRREIGRVRPDLPADLDGAALLMTDLGLDSLDVVELVARVEESFRICVADEDWPTLRCLNRIADHVIAHSALERG